MPKLSLDPRTKLFLLIILVVFTIITPSLAEEIAMLLIVSALVILHREVKKCFTFLVGYTVLRGILYGCIYLPGTLASVLMIICSMMCKMLPTVMYVFCILLTTRISSLITAMQHLGIPQKITITLAAALRFIPTAFEELKNIRDAMKMRGINITLKNLLTRPGPVFEGAVIPLMLRSATIAEELSVSSITRGLDSDRKRTSIESLHFGLPDIIAVSGMLLPLLFHLLAKLRL